MGSVKPGTLWEQVIEIVGEAAAQRLIDCLPGRLYISSTRTGKHWERLVQVVGESAAAALSEFCGREIIYVPYGTFPESDPDCVRRVRDQVVLELSEKESAHALALRVGVSARTIFNIRKRYRNVSHYPGALA